ncbi:MAG: M28 family peptidase [Candidatus Heimdallarchaeota archaeon]|nr:M28 family peptidase [Candidatus Heimdallarchaeota archaeon]
MSVDKDNLYAHVKNLQGVKHALTNYEGLVQGADYMKQEFESLGLEVIEEKFMVDGCDLEFRNIIGCIGGAGPEIIISGHHDTVWNAPGANDNGTACAAIIEMARIFKEMNIDANIRLVSFDLEESNPYFEKTMWELAAKHNIRNNMIFENLQYRENWGKIMTSYLRLLNKEKRSELLEDINKLSDDEIAFYTEMLEFLDEFFEENSWVGKTALMGSARYVENAIKEGREIKAIINFDTIGYTSNRSGSQFYPTGFPIRLMKLLPKWYGRFIPKLSKIFRFYGIEDITVGDFASLLVDGNSEDLGMIFAEKAKQIELKVGGIFTGMTYDRIEKQMPDLLRSDHAPFWREGVKGIFISDTANFRYAHYHTTSDRIEYVNFDFLAKITQASIETVLELV